MFAIGTSMPGTAPALAALADGTVSSAIPAGTAVGTASYARNPLNDKRFCDRRSIPTKGLVDVRVT